MMMPKTPRFWPEMEDATGVFRVGAAVSLVDIGPLDRTAGQCLGAVDDVPQGMTVVGVIGQRPGMQHEQATGRTAVVGDDGGFDTELVRRGQQLGIGREGDGLRLHGGIDRDPQTDKLSSISFAYQTDVARLR